MGGGGDEVDDGFVHFGGVIGVGLQVWKYTDDDQVRETRVRMCMIEQLHFFCFRVEKL